MCEHPFVSSGAAHAAFRRAIGRRHLAQALAAAHDLPVISLADALELVLLAAEKDPATFDRAAARWLGRYLGEVRDADLAEAALVLGALEVLPGKHHAAGRDTLLSLAARRNLRDVGATLRRTR
jgi:CHAD domain-containing protein